MSKTRKIYTKELFKHGNFISEVTPEVHSFPCGATNLIRMGKFICLNCGKEFIAPLASAERTQRKCCSYECTWEYKHNSNLGTESHYLYTRWLGMRQRCLNPTSTNFRKYGARGITMDPTFNDFTKYVEAVEGLPSFPGEAKVKALRLQLDRIDNNKGYWIDNLRWISVSGNTSNRNKWDNQTKSKYIGVTFAKNKRNNQWISGVFYEKKWIFRQGFSSEEEAALARDQFIIQNNLPHKLNILSRNATTIPNGSTSK